VKDSRVFGELRLEIVTFDETAESLPIRKIIRWSRRPGTNSSQGWWGCKPTSFHGHSIWPASSVLLGSMSLSVVQLGEETITATAGCVVRIPPGVPHALRNQAIDSARVLSAAAWNRADFFQEASKYLEGVPRKE